MFCRVYSAVHESTTIDRRQQQAPTKHRTRHWVRETPLFGLFHPSGRRTMNGRLVLHNVQRGLQNSAQQNPRLTPTTHEKAQAPQQRGCARRYASTKTDRRKVIDALRRFETAIHIIDRLYHKGRVKTAIKTDSESVWMAAFIRRTSITIRLSVLVGNAFISLCGSIDHHSPVGLGGGSGVQTPTAGVPAHFCGYQGCVRLGLLCRTREVSLDIVGEESSMALISDVGERIPHGP